MKPRFLPQGPVSVITMSHEISNIDKQQGLEMAWHNLTEVLPEISLDSCWLSRWDVEKTTLHIQEGEIFAPTEFCQLTATDDPKIRIGKPVHCDTYQPIKNADFLAIVSKAIAEIPGVKIASVGSVCERGRVFVSVQLEELAEFKAAGRPFNAFLNFMNSHDLSAPFAVTTSNICTVCNNTFGFNLASVQGVRSGLKAATEATAKAQAIRIRLKHTKNVADRLENVPEIVDGFLGAQALFKAKLDAMMKEQISEAKARDFFAGFLVKDADEEIKTRKAGQIDRLTELFKGGAGNRGENLADVFGAVTDYYSHESSGGENRMKQYQSSEFGAGQAAKTRAWNILQDVDEVNRLVTVGAVALASADN